MQAGKVNHESRQKGLTGGLIGLAQAAGDFHGDGSVALPHLDRCPQAQHVVDGALGQADGAGDCGADNIASLIGVATVARLQPEIKHQVHDYVSMLHSGRNEEFNHEYLEAHESYVGLVVGE